MKKDAVLVYDRMRDSLVRGFDALSAQMRRLPPESFVSDYNLHRLDELIERFERLQCPSRLQ